MTSPRQKQKRLSEIIATFVDKSDPRAVSISSLLEAVEDRAFGALLLLFAAPNLIPGPPGVSGILGLPLLVLSAQMMFGLAPWLPKFITDREISQRRFVQFSKHLLPWLTRAEKLLVPRWWWLTNQRAEKFIGAFVFILSLVLFLPIPLGNLLPALAIIIIAFGVLERDGLWIAAGVVVGTMSLAIAFGVVYALTKAAIFLLLSAFR